VDGSGANQTSYAYSPYGATTASGAASTNVVAYTGRENDANGLYYYRARYCNPTCGRFSSSTD
jgi:RHS repeat-associated protein